MRKLLTVCAFVSLLAGIACVHAPPALTPAATEAFYGTRVIQALDLVRDAAVNANAQTPPLVSTASTRQILLYHEAAITVIHAIPTGWQSTLQTGLVTLLKVLSPAESATLSPYVTLLQTILSEVQ